MNTTKEKGAALSHSAGPGTGLHGSCINRTVWNLPGAGACISHSLVQRGLAYINITAKARLTTSPAMKTTNTVDHG